MNIKKEFIPFIVGLNIICLNVPVITLLYFFNPDFIGLFAITIVPIESIIMGLITIYGELKSRKNEQNNYEVCNGVIKGTKFKLLNFKWIKAPVVSYIVDGKNYETTANFGINGIFNFLIKDKTTKVYYKKDNPKITLINNNVPIIVGTGFIVAGIFVFFVFMFN